MRALASSDSRASRRDARRLDRLVRAPQAVGRRRRARRRHALGFDPHVVGLDVQLATASRRRDRARSPACSSAWRSAVAELMAENTSLRAASTSASSPSISRCAGVVGLRLRRPSRGRGAIALGVGVGRRLAARRRARRAPARAATSSVVELRGHARRPRRRATAICSRSNAICCCWRLMASSRACAASRAVSRALRPRPARSARGRDRLRPAATRAAATDSRSRASASRPRADSIVSAS